MNGWNNFLLKICNLFIVFILILSYLFLGSNCKAESSKMIFVGGTESGNYSSIQDAVNDAFNGDTIYVYNGTYHEYIVINKSINLICKNKNSVFIDSNNNIYTILIKTSWINISGFNNDAGYSTTTGTVTSVGIADSGSSEFTVANSPITSSGTITLEVNAIDNSKITGLGTAATLNVGTSANNVVQLNGSAQLPAVDGSNLTNLPDNSIPFAIALG